MGSAAEDQSQVTVRLLKPRLSQSQGARIAGRARRSAGLGNGAADHSFAFGHAGLEYELAWLLWVHVSFRRLLLRPRETLVSVLVDARSGRAEECAIDSSLFAGEELGESVSPAAISEERARDIGFRKVFDGVIMRNHTYWVPDVVLRDTWLLHVPSWVFDGKGDERVHVNALTGAVRREVKECPS